MPNIDVDVEKIKKVYLDGINIFNDLYGYYPRIDVEEVLSKKWLERKPKTDDDFIQFYKDNILVAEELALWHNRRNGFRRTRAINAYKIAKDRGCKTFFEIGCGIGTDAIALTMMGLKPVFLADISKHCVEFTKKQFKHYFPDMDVPIYHVDEMKLQDADMFFSSDVIEHLKEPEKFMDSIIDKFKLGIIYAPFGKNNIQPQHTSYPARKFHKYMEKKNFDKVVYNLGVPPFVYVRNEK